MPEVKVSTPVCTNTKATYVVGLTEEDNPKSVFDAVTKPGKNHPIAHLIKPCSFSVREVVQCNYDEEIYRATVHMSEDIYDIVSTKMNSKVIVDYLSCTVFDKPDPIRCHQC